MRKFIVLALPCLAIVGGCTSESSPTGMSPNAMSPTEKVYVRADGKRLNGNPELMAKLDADRNFCSTKAVEVGLTSKTGVNTKDVGGKILAFGLKAAKAADAMQVCMAQHNYLYMTVAEAELRADELAAKPKKRRKLRTAMN